MRSFILVPACLRSMSAAPSNEESVSLMQRRLLKQAGLDTHKSDPEKTTVVHEVMDTLGGYVNDEPPAYGEEPPHVCGKWSAWGKCTVSCGGGLETREYTHVDGVKCGKSCPHGNGDKQQRACNTDVPCPIDCEGSWGLYGACDALCDGGNQSRMYTITQEAMHGGKCCPKSNGAVEDHPCATEKCERHCKGHWQDWSECSNGGAGYGLDCGPGGVQSRGYTVMKERTSGGCVCEAMMWGSTTFVDVDASTVDTRSCELPCCKKPCEGSWSDWGECEGATSLGMEMSNEYTDVPTKMCCGGGMKSKTFTVEKEKECGGKCCEAASGAVMTDTCCEAPCPVDCEGHWGDEGACCSECGGGQTESIYIVTQEALHGGKECPRKPGAIKHNTCNTKPCAIKCEGHWSEWDVCTEECCSDTEGYGGTEDCGTQSRHWIVTKEAKHGGLQCTHLDQVEVRPCEAPKPPPCPIPGLCQWTEYGDCDACCSDGVTPIMKYRKWVEITAPQYGGAECKNSPPYGDSEEAICGKPRCPIDCKGHWGKYDTCNAQIADCGTNEYGTDAGGHFCGRGTQTKMYHVTVEAQFGGDECCHEDGHKESKLCGEVDCPIHCVGDFTEWGDCCSSCGGGSQSRDFVIKQQAEHCGLECSHIEHTEHRVCNEQPCPVPCEGSWSCWGECNQDCTDCHGAYGSGTVGKSMRTYTIHQPALYDGPQCPHKDGEVEEKTCNDDCCPENCEGSWSEFSECSTSCGNGVTERFYQVTHPAAYGGKACPFGDNCSHTKACPDTSRCPVDCVGDFSSWSCCSEKCGGGETSAWFIQHQTAQHGGQECEHGQFEQVTKECNTQECPQMCLGAFGPWGACDADCSGGTKSRKFMVFRPAAGGAPECSHADGDVDTAPCHEHECPDGYVCPPTKTCKYSNGLIQVR